MSSFAPRTFENGIANAAPATAERFTKSLRVRFFMVNLPLTGQKTSAKLKLGILLERKNLPF
jgi:hypothetical protein